MLAALIATLADASPTANTGRLSSTEDPDAPATEPPPWQADACTSPGNEGTPTMVALRPGRFTMGSPTTEQGRYDDEGPQHQVMIPRPFALSRCEITVAQFRQFVVETGHVTSAEQQGSPGCYRWDNEQGKAIPDRTRNWRDPGFTQTGSHPVVCVSWTDAQAYVDWLSRRTGAPYRLPTEAEWEYAARADKRGANYWDARDQCAFANGAGQETRSIAGSDWTLADCTDPFVHTAPVASLRPNSFQLYDMLGNVWEWTLDCWHENYTGAPSDGGAWLGSEEACTKRVVRGGSWIDVPRNLRSAIRFRFATGVAGGNLGFRIARAL